MNAKIIIAPLFFCLGSASPNVAVAAEKNIAQYVEPLATEEVPNVAELATPYPESWVILHDFNFNSISDGRAVIVDVDAPNNNYKGMVPVVHMGNALSSRKASEIYVSETYYSRFDRGERTDVISIWDMATLRPKGEVILPGGKRLQGVTVTNNFQLLNDGKWAGVYNFSPAQSVTIVDLAERNVLGDIDTPGCSSVYPMRGKRFAMLCSDGTIATITLDDNGKLVSSDSTDVVNNIDDDPMFMMPAMIGDTAWFATFLGNLKAVDLSGEKAKITAEYSLVGGGNEVNGYRPTGWQTIASDNNGMLYILMNPEGKEGSHKNPSTEVWVFDTKTEKTTKKLTLAAPSISLGATNQVTPKLVVARADGQVDVYEIGSGKLLNTLGSSIAFNPMIVSAIGQ